MNHENAPAVSTTAHPKARKPHKCCECLMQIEKGDIYERVEGLWDGRWYTCKSCDRCAKLRTHCFNEWEYEHLKDDMLYEYGVEYTTETFEEILQMIKDSAR